MNRLRRQIPGALLSALVLALLSSASASAAGTLDVWISGHGTVSGDGISCLASAAGEQSGDCQGLYEDAPLAPTVTMTAVAGSGWSFAGWAGGCTNVEPQCQTTMDADKSVTALFRADALDSVAITAPAPGIFVTGEAVPVVGALGSAAGIARIDFLRDGTEIHSAWESPYSTTFSTAGLADGAPIALEARAVDIAGNSQLSATHTVYADNTAPDVTSMTGPDGGSFASGSAQEWQFSTSDGAGSGLASQTCAIDEAKPVGCASSFRVQSLPAGEHTFTLTVTDKVEKVTRVSRTFTIEPPTNSTATTTGGSVATDTHVPASSPFACALYPIGSTPALVPCYGAGTALGAGPTVLAKVAARLARTFTVSRLGVVITRLRLTGITRGARLTVGCKGSGCPFRLKRVSVRRNAADLVKLFSGKRLKPGAVVVIALAKPGMRPRQITLTMRKQGQPALKVSRSG